MIKKPSPAKKELSAKDKIFTETIQLLASSLRVIKDALGEKKFEKRIKKAAKLLTQGFKLPAAKQVDAEKSIVTKAPVGRPRKIVDAKPENGDTTVTIKKGSVGRPRKIEAEKPQKEAKSGVIKKGSVGRPRKIVTATPEKQVKATSKKKAAPASKAVKGAPKK